MEKRPGSKNLTLSQAKVIIVYAKNKMNAAKAAKELCCADCTVHNHLNAVRDKLGLDPRNGDGLEQIVPLAKAKLGRVNMESLRLGCNTNKCAARNQPRKKETLCWDCVNAVKKCPWSRSFKPVPGWDAIPTKIKMECARLSDSYMVKDCPMFEAESESARTLLAQGKRPPDKLKYAISLYKAGRSYDEIAAELGKTKKEVRAMLYLWYDE